MDNSWFAEEDRPKKIPEKKVIKRWMDADNEVSDMEFNIAVLEKSDWGQSMQGLTITKIQLSNSSIHEDQITCWDEQTTASKTSTNTQQPKSKPIHPTSNQESNSNYPRKLYKPFSKNRQPIDIQLSNQLPKQQIKYKTKSPNQSPNPSANQSAKKLVIEPRGRKCWPEASIYIMKAKITVSYRLITEFEADLLIIPYNNLKLDIYPGNIINSCRVDYRKKIQQKGQKLLTIGSTYIQKCLGIDNYLALVFFRVESHPTLEIHTHIAQLFNTLSKVTQINTHSIVFPYSPSVCDATALLNTVIQQLENYQGFKEVFITTNNANDFKEVYQVFQKKTIELMDNNEICIE